MGCSEGNLMNAEKNKIQFYKPLITVIFMVIVMFTSMVYYQADPQIPLMFGCLVAGLVAVWMGFTWEKILEGALKGISQSLEAILILLLIGVLVGVWIACGTVPAMIYYGLKMISARYFLPTAMMICVIVAFAIGSWGTIGTVGLAFMGMGTALHISAPVVAGCIVSGAYMGEVISPLSDATNLTAAVVGENVFQIVRRMAKPAIIAFGITMVCYFVIGRQYTGGTETQLGSDIGSLLDSIKGQFSISPFELLPMALMAACILLKFPAIPSMLAGILCGLLEALFLQRIEISQILNVSYNGFICESGNPLVDDLLSAGGMNEMLYSISIIIIAMSFGGIMQHTGQIETLLNPLIRRIQSKGSLTLVTVLSCISMNVILPDQYLGISLPGQMYEKTYADRNIDRSDLAMTLLGGGAVTSPLVPWNTCGIYVMTILSVPAVSYGPYAFYSILLPLTMIILGYIKKKN